MSDLVERGAKAVGDALEAAFDPLDFRTDMNAVVFRGAVGFLLAEMATITKAMRDAGDAAVSDCYSLEPGEGFDDDPAPAAYDAMRRAFAAENGLTINKPEAER